MAHLQPRGSSGARARPRQIRLTAIRGFMSSTESLSGNEVKEIWQEHFRTVRPDHPYWLYTHIPFCPQICSFCQCSTSLHRSAEQLAAYLRWLEGEIEFLASAAESGRVRFQYVGGGTPNILSEAQLAALLGRLNERFRFEPAARRTFEFLPSALRGETLALVRSFGFNRLSCGVQSMSGETLKAVSRSEAGLDDLGRMIEGAYALGYDEINVDLIHGIGAESEERFLAGLIELLALSPTTVTIHHVIPTPTNPVFSSIEEEVGAYATFERLEAALGESVARRFPHVDWVLRPNAWVLVDRRFHGGPEFSTWYYSDNERIHIDMLGLGRFAHSNIPGKILYENLSRAERYDPAEPSYRSFRKTPAVDAALDLITDLAGDRRSKLAPIRRRYGEQALTPLYPVLARLQRDGSVTPAGEECFAAPAADGVFIDPFWSLLEEVLPKPPPASTVPTNKSMQRAIRVGEGEHSLLVFVERIEADKPYFVTLGSLGIYYRRPDHLSPARRAEWVEALMNQVVTEARTLLERQPDISPGEAAARLKHHFRREPAAR